MAIAIINNQPASAHARRVTLNLLRHAFATPDSLMPALNRIHECGYDLASAVKEDLELVFGTVDDALCARVLAEYEVDTSTMRDYGFPYWRSGPSSRRHVPPSWFEGVHEVDCRLCGHKHNRYEFLARNKAGGTDVWMGSTCIRKFGLTVDGESTAEAALKALSGAMAKSKKAQTCDEWQKANPNHKEVMDALAGTLSSCERYWAWTHLRLLPMRVQQWRSRTKELAKTLRAALKYYRANGYLTKKRTTDVLHNASLLMEAKVITSFSKGMLEGRDMSKCIVAADGSIEVDPNLADHAEYWQAFINDNQMNQYQTNCIAKLRDLGIDPEDVANGHSPTLSVRQFQWLSSIVEEVKAQNAEPEPEPEQTSLPF